MAEKEEKDMKKQIKKCDYIQQNKSAKPRWKCPKCTTVNSMTANCSSCKKDCFNFQLPLSLVTQDEEEEVKSPLKPLMI